MKLSTVNKIVNSLPESYLQEIKKRSCPHSEYFYNSIIESKSTSVVEVGTFKGLNTLYMAAACDEVMGGEVVTININRRETDIAKDLVGKAGLSNVQFIVGDSIEVLKNLPVAYIDFAFIDGNHSYHYSKTEYDLVCKKMSNGIIIFDDSNYVHADGISDGGVPKTIKEVGAEQIPQYPKLSKIVIG